MIGTGEIVEGWCNEQLGAWAGQGWDVAAAALEQRRYNEDTPFLFAFRVRGGQVGFDDKGPSATAAASAALDRAGLYRSFLQSVVDLCGPLPDMLLHLDVGDHPCEGVKGPIFSFQKMVGSKNILLPDVDFFYWSDYTAPQLQDGHDYFTKLTAAIFVGSTTGRQIVTEAAIDAGAVPRIKSALFFVDKPEVDFRLPRLVHLDGDATDQRLRAMGLGVGEASWAEQLRYRFLISMDGNGAACSRVFIALRSNSVLLKYASDSQLFYFNSLQPWVHYIPIANDAEILDVVEQERLQPGKFSAIAQAGHAFATTLLHPEALRAYTHRLLSKYAEVGEASMNRLDHAAGGCEVQEPAGAMVAARNKKEPNMDQTRDAALPAQDSIPDHAGVDYRTVIRNMHAWLAPKTYLEVGVEGGHTFSLAACRSVAVDPAFQMADPAVFASLLARPMCALYQMPSDAFFREFDPARILGGPIDLAFLDGMHHCEYLLRDFMNTERSCRPASVIMLHDCFPLEAPMAARQPGAPAVQPSRTGMWTGDVWRTALLLKRFRPDLRIIALDASPTGLLLVTNLDPASTVLSDSYFSLVDEMRNWTLEGIGLNELGAEIGMFSTEAVDTAEKTKLLLAA